MPPENSPKRPIDRAIADLDTFDRTPDAPDNALLIVDDGQIPPTPDKPDDEGQTHE